MPFWFDDVTRCDIRYVICLILRSVAAAVAAAVATATAVAATAAAAAAVTATAVTAATTFTAAAVAAATATATAVTAAAAAFTAATSTAAAVWATEASRTLFAWTCFVHDDSAASNGLTVQTVDSGLCFCIGAHFDEAETFGAASVTIHHDLGRAHAAELGESVIQILIAHAVGQIAHVKFVAHERAPFTNKVTMWSFNPSGPIPKTVPLPDTDLTIMVEQITFS